MKLILKNAKTVRLAKGLTSLEFQCRCSYKSCCATIVHPKFIKAFDDFRKLVGVKLKINSGYRCPEHNFFVGGSPKSRHITGEAIDISLKSLDHLDQEEIDHAAKIAGFTFTKFYKTFVHMDVR